MARELHLLKVKRVEVVFFFSNLIKITFSFEVELLILEIKTYKIL
jgi:hypothetical protein